MRGIAIVSTLVLAGGLLSACQEDSCRTTYLTQESAAAVELALSCAESLTIGEVSYNRWCAGVRPELLGDTRYTGALQTDTYVARPIDDVPIEQAIAIASRMEGNRAANQAGDEECGRWLFAPAFELEQREAKRLARSVTIPGTLDLD